MLFDSSERVQSCRHRWNLDVICPTYPRVGCLVVYGIFDAPLLQEGLAWRPASSVCEVSLSTCWGNLVYHHTQDEQVYAVISRRMRDGYDIFGSLPDTTEDEWIDSIEELEQRMDEYIHLRDQAHNAFEMRYQETIDPDKDRWELCSRVLSRRDIVDKLSAAW